MTTSGRAWLRFGVWWTPVVIGALLFAGFFPVAPSLSPVAVVAGLVPAALLLAALWWMDRLEPEPRDAVVFALLWGALAATTVSLFWNSAVEGVFGEAVAVVVGAPLMEEATKGAVLVVLLRRRLIDSTIDGAVYAVASAVGFAVVEDISYFTAGFAREGVGGLLQVVVLRGVLTPFAHPMFSIWMGMAAGWIAERRPPRGVAVVVAGGSYALAVGLHAFWNGMAFLSTSNDVFWTVYLAFAALLVATTLTVAVLRRAQSRRFEREVPHVASMLGMRPGEVALFASTRTYLTVRRSMARPQRRDLASLRWTLHAIATLTRVAPRDAQEYAADAAELDALCGRAQTLRSRLTVGATPFG